MTRNMFSRLMIGTVLAGGVATAGVLGAGAAQATPPPPSPLCAIYSYPAVVLIELTGGQASPLLPAANAIQPLFCP
ncbi:hypothetical protein [Nocardia mangyaensis]|uniref:hypothetical protein n=1 Tax=Nocardia mangyaensis TaxID=2213200 RepID=UPI0026744D62|nr:hypothetical protein [Nocardia mangyaensis]MDO3650691.1 hypothetical protein [Nocardia mangyaensis]